MTAARLLVALVVLLFASSPVAAQLWVEQVDVQGHMAASTPAGQAPTFIVLRPPPDSHLTLAAEARELTEQFIGLETIQVHQPTSVAATHDYEPEDARSGGSGRITISAIHEDAMILIRPLSPLTGMSLSLDGDVSVTPVADELIERTHQVAPPDLRTTSQIPDEFEFRARDTAKLAATAEGFQSVSGDFQLYLYGVSYQASGDGALHSRRTGHEVVDGQPSTATVERYLHAFLTLHGASLTIQHDALPVAIYADAGAAEVDGALALHDASGHVFDDRGEEYAVTGHARMAAASMQWSGGAAGLSLSVSMADHLAGDVARVSMAWNAPAASVVALATLSAVVLWVWLRPLRAGGDVEEPRGSPEARARGWAAMARGSGARGQHGRAAWYARRAIRGDPVNAEYYGLLAVACSNRGRFAHALEHHKMAHWIHLAQKASDSEVARNAFEASCVAANLCRSREAIHWLRIALHHDPTLQGEAALEPDLGPISQEPGFQCLVAGVVDVRWGSA